jgi:hypothetical protein
MDGQAAGGAREGGFWQAFSAAIAILARQSGCSLSDSPVPEIREAVRDFAVEWSRPRSGETR